jgi:hypothetical protein
MTRVGSDAVVLRTSMARLPATRALSDFYDPVTALDEGDMSHASFVRLQRA